MSYSHFLSYWLLSFLIHISRCCIMTVGNSREFLGNLKGLSGIIVARVSIKIRRNSQRIDLPLITFKIPRQNLRVFRKAMIIARGLMAVVRDSSSVRKAHLLSRHLARGRTPIHDVIVLNYQGTRITTCFKHIEMRRSIKDIITESENLLRTYI